MARGWESKHVEAQQDQAWSERLDPAAREAGALDQRRALELARADLRSRLAAARAQSHRAAIDQALAEIERRLASIA